MASDMSRAAHALDVEPSSAPGLEHEFDLIRGAVALLADGWARRVTLVAMSLDEESLREAGLLVRSSGMVMRAVKGQGAWDVTIEASA
jgi:hypothetical protein